MNPEKLLDEVSNLLADAHRIGLVTAHLCFFKNKLFVGHPEHTRAAHRIFLPLNFNHIVNGLTQDEWNRLSIKLCYFFERDKKCEKI